MKLKKYKLQLSGKNILYFQTGRGPTVLFLHGLGIGTEIWDKVYKNLSKKFSVILLDLPGYGLNVNLIIDPKFETIKNFLNDFIEKKGSINYLVGYSLSGVFAYQIAQKPPHSLKKIICISTPMFNSSNIFTVKYIFKAIGFQSFITRIFVYIIKRFPVKHLIFLAGGLASITKPKAMDICMNLFGEKSDLSYIFKFAANIFVKTKYTNISIPIDFVFGDLDGFATTNMAKTAQSYCQKSNLQIIKNAYHLLPLEYPEKLSYLISESFKSDKIFK